MGKLGFTCAAALLALATCTARVSAQPAPPELPAQPASTPLVPAASGAPAATAPVMPAPQSSAVEATSKPVEKPLGLNTDVQQNRSAVDRAERTLSATDWAFGSKGWEAFPLGVAAGLALGSQLVPQRRSSWGPDSPRSPDSSSDVFSYVTVGGAMVLGLAHYVLKGEALRGAGVSTPYVHALPVLFADVEAVALAFGVTEMIKRRAGRCRPRAWQGGACDPSSDENFKAFPSGHTMIPSALAGVHFVELLRDPSVLNVSLCASIEVTAIATGLLRYTAGAHSLSDVGMGYTIGHVSGMLIAVLHPRTELKRGNTSRAPMVVRPTLGFDGRVLTMSAAF